MITPIKNFGLGYLLLGALILSSCGSQGGTAETPPVPMATDTEQIAASESTVAEQIAEFAQRPELQDEESQAILKEAANDPLMLEVLKEIYSLPAAGAAEEDLVPQEEDPSLLSAQGSSKLTYVKGVSWGSIGHYFAEKRSPNYRGLNWRDNGCSLPVPNAIKPYGKTFLNSCKVHDFGYGNLPKLLATKYWYSHRLATDQAFHRNMRSQCAPKSWVTRGACNRAADGYYLGVRKWGGSHWHR